jgi:hypothetical protein
MGLFEKIAGSIEQLKDQVAEKIAEEASRQAKKQSRAALERMAKKGAATALALAKSAQVRALAILDPEGNDASGAGAVSRLREDAEVPRDALGQHGRALEAERRRALALQTQAEARVRQAATVAQSEAAHKQMQREQAELDAELMALRERIAGRPK